MSEVFDLQVSVAKTYKVKVGDEVFDVREPAMGEIEHYSDISSLDAKAQVKSSKEFISSLGLPIDVIDKLPISAFEQLVEFILSKSKKK